LESVNDWKLFTSKKNVIFDTIGRSPWEYRKPPFSCAKPIHFTDGIAMISNIFEDGRSILSLFNSYNYGVWLTLFTVFTIMVTIYGVSLYFNQRSWKNFLVAIWIYSPTLLGKGSKSLPLKRRQILLLYTLWIICIIPVIRVFRIRVKKNLVIPTNRPVASNIREAVDKNLDILWFFRPHAESLERFGNDEFTKNLEKLRKRAHKLLKGENGYQGILSYAVKGKNWKDAVRRLVYIGDPDITDLIIEMNPESRLEKFEIPLRTKACSVICFRRNFDAMKQASK